MLAGLARLGSARLGQKDRGCSGIILLSRWAVKRSTETSALPTPGIAQSGSVASRVVGPGRSVWCGLTHVKSNKETYPARILSLVLGVPEDESLRMQEAPVVPRGAASQFFKGTS